MEDEEMYGNELRWMIEVCDRRDEYKDWSIGIFLSHSLGQTYLHINLFVITVDIGYLIDYWPDNNQPGRWAIKLPKFKK